MISSLILNTTHDQMELKEISDLGNTCFLTSFAFGDMFFRRTRWIAAQSQEVHLIENRS